MFRATPVLAFLSVCVATASAQNGVRTLKFTAEVNKVVAAKDVVTSVTVTAQSKKLGIDNADLMVNAKTKFVYVDDNGTRELTQKTVLADAEAKAWLAVGKTVQVRTTQATLFECRFGPNATKK